MKVRLTPDYELSNEHPASFRKEPVLVNVHTDEAYQRSDIIEPYPTWAFMPACLAVVRMVRGKKLTRDEAEFVRRFTGGSADTRH